LAKELKEKRKKIGRARKKEQPYSLWASPAEKKTRKREEKGSRPTHTKKYMSFHFLSN